MCGLVGLATFKQNGFNYNEVDAFTNLLVVAAIRGPHGTGIFTVDTKGKRNLVKNVGNPYNLIYTKDYTKAVDAQKQPYITVLAGHNRWATTGKHVTENSHPFFHGNITMMHNGTLKRYDKFPKVFEVDSESLCYAIDQMGIEDAVGYMDGAYAVVYYDSDKGTLNFARNYERPLYMSYSPKEKILMWASEKGMAHWVNHRHKVADDFKFEELPTNELWSYTLGNPKPHVKKLPYTGQKLYQSSTVTHTGGAYQLPKPEPKPQKRLALVSKPETGPTSADRIAWVDTLEKPYKRYWVGDDIVFKPTDYRILSGKEKYQIICKREDLPPDVTIKFVISGKEMMEVIMDEPILGGTISTIAKIDHNHQYQHTVVWVKDVSLSEPDGRRQGARFPTVH